MEINMIYLSISPEEREEIMQMAPNSFYKDGKFKDKVLPLDGEVFNLSKYSYTYVKLWEKAILNRFSQLTDKQIAIYRPIMILIIQFEVMNGIMEKNKKERYE